MFIPTVSFGKVTKFETQTQTEYLATIIQGGKERRLLVLVLTKKITVCVFAVFQLLITIQSSVFSERLCDIGCKAKSEFPFCGVLHVGRLSVLMDSDENN